MNSKGKTLKIRATDTSSKPTDYVANNREKLLQQKFIEQSKKFYCNKHKISSNNIFANAFSTLNHRILNEIELGNKKRNSDKGSNEFYRIRHYNKIYSENSSEVLKMMRLNRIKTDNETRKENKLIREIKKLDLKKHTLKKDTYLDRNSSLPQIYGNNNKMNFKLENEKNTKEIDFCFKRIDQKLRGSSESDLNNLLSFMPQKVNSRVQNFSKKAYLASLNVSFANPII
jgi:hypothetical protein